MIEPEAAGMRLAIYARVSTEEQREGQTINSQVAELERFAREKGWIITGAYKDEGWSGGIMERPDLDRLRDDAYRGAFQAVLINDVDRLARDVAHLGVIKRDLEKRGIRVIFRKLPSDTSPTNNLMVNILGSFAEFERELITDRTRRGRRHAVEVRKQYLSSHTSYGYRYTPKDRTAGNAGRLEVEPSEACVVRQMFEWVDSEGLSAWSVVRRLNERGILAQKGASWGKSSVLRILHNEMYAGTWHYNKAQGCEPARRKNDAQYRRRTKSSVRMRPREEWIPLELPEPLRLVPRDRWERVQDRIQRNIAFSPRNEKHFYLLKGLVKCGGCGRRYVGDPCHGKFYYRCLNRCKRQPSVSESRLDDAVLEAIERVLLTPSLILKEIEYLYGKEAEASRNRSSARLQAEKKTRQIQVEENRLLEAYRAEIISPAQLGLELEGLRARPKAAELQRGGVDVVNANLPVYQIRKPVEEYCAEARRNFRSLDRNDLREFLRTVVQSIVFKGSEVQIQGHLPIAAPSSDSSHQHPVAFHRSAEIPANLRLGKSLSLH
jgi:site-specific DNA recombinase